MKRRHGLLIFALTVLLNAFTSPGVLAGGAVLPATEVFGNHSIYLNALKPDLEYLRGYWLKNPGEKSREGRIVFPNNSQILIQFERAANAINDNAWDGDYLKLKNIYQLHQKDSTHSTPDELFYKHTTFYARSNPHALPETVESVDNVLIRTLPVRSGNNKKPSIEVRYTDLNTLGKEIEREVSRIDSESTEESTVVTVKICENQFVFEYVKDRVQLFVRHVRTITFRRRYREPRHPVQPRRDYHTYPYDYSDRYSDDSVNVHEDSDDSVNVHEDTDTTPSGDYVQSNDYSFIRYDRATKSFYSSKNVMLDDMSVVRSSFGNYVLKDNTGRVADCVVPGVSAVKGNLTSTTGKPQEIGIEDK